MEQLKWIHFWDMHSGGGIKEEPYQHIYIEATSQDAAEVIFYNRFEHNPNRVTCTCCGSDYSVSEYDTLEAATEFQRSDYEGRNITSLEAYCNREDVLVVRDAEVKDSERQGNVPAQGYVWVG
jgi:hypothetical protein